MQAEEGSPQFWAFVEAWAGRGGGHGSATQEQDCWADILAAAAPHTLPGLAALMPLVLSSRKYSPRLELFSTLAADSAPPQQVRVWLPDPSLSGVDRVTGDCANTVLCRAAAVWLEAHKPGRQAQQSSPGSHYLAYVHACSSRPFLPPCVCHRNSHGDLARPPITAGVLLGGRQRARRHHGSRA